MPSSAALRSQPLAPLTLKRLRTSADRADRCLIMNWNRCLQFRMTRTSCRCLCMLHGSSTWRQH